ncbi:LysR family transcriptional regulator, partial [Halomonas sp. ATBC28]
ELVRRGLGWTVVDFLTAGNLDPATVVAVPLRDREPIPLYAYHAEHRPPDRHAARMLDLLPGLLHAVLARPHHAEGSPAG